MSRFTELFPGRNPVIGMIHLPPLPGYAESRGVDDAIAQAVRDLHILKDNGIDGVLVENEYDRPHSIVAGPATIAAMTRITRAVVQESGTVVVGCEILLNDPQASLAVAKMSGAQFIRTDYFVDAMTRPGYGEFALDAPGLIAYRKALDAEEILVLADIQVKYATMIAPRPMRESARHACDAGADAVIVTGDASGDAPRLDDLREATAGSSVPVLIGSGLDSGNAKVLMGASDGAIVGSALMRNRHPDAAAIRAIMAQLGRPRR
jgi:hypothetical protein